MAAHYPLLLWQKGIGVLRVAAWNHDGSRLAVAGTESGIRFLDKAGNPDGAILSESATLRSLAWHRSGLLATGSDDTTARLWNEEGKQKSVFREHTKSVFRVSWDATGQHLVSGGADGKLRVWGQGWQDN